MEILGLVKKNVGEDNLKIHSDIAKVAQEVVVRCVLPLAVVAEPCHPRKRHRSGATLHIS